MSMSETKKKGAKPKSKLGFWALFYLIASLVIVGILSLQSPFQALESKAYDYFMAVVRGARERPGNILIVAVDDLSLKNLQERGWGRDLPRRAYAELLEQLNAGGARAIAFDVVFEDETTSEDDALLAQAIRSSRAPVVLAVAWEVQRDERTQSTREMRPLPVFLEAGAGEASALLNADPDGVLRQYRLFAGGEPSLAARLIDVSGAEIERDDIPVSSRQGSDPQIFINYAGGARTIRTVSLYQALDAQQSLPADIFKDQFVLVGYSRSVSDLATTDASKDHYPSPFDLVSRTTSMPGVEAHANALDTLLRGITIRRRLPRESTIMALLLGTALLIVLTRRWSFAWRIGLSLSLIVLLGIACALAFVYLRQWMPPFQPMSTLGLFFLTTTLHQYRASERERAHIRKALEGYVSPQVMAQVLARPGDLELGGIEVQATVLFTDIAGFSSISEDITASAVASLLNDYFTLMGDAVMLNRGMINKFIGDSIMAIWGVPLAEPTHAALACRTALEMNRIVRERTRFKTRIGINTGRMVAGNIGHRKRMEYTVIGDAVNLASRLEGANKAFGTAILISETTAARLGDDFILRQADRIRVVGRGHPAVIYELCGMRDGSDAAALVERASSFNSIVEPYEARQWSQALAAAEDHVRRHPDDPLGAVYLERCRLFAAAPPDDDWDGVFQLKSK